MKRNSLLFPVSCLLFPVSCLLFAVSCLLPPVSCSAPITVITNYFPGYVLATNGWTAAADGVFIPLSILTNATTANCAADGAGSDVRVLMYAINDRAVAGYDAMGTNAPANAEFEMGITIKSTTEFETKHTVRTQRTFGNSTIKAE
jgi:hypothetical protein